MPGNRGRDNSDDVSNILYTRKLWKGRKHSIDLAFSSDINRKLFRRKTWKCKKNTTKKPNVKVMSAHADILDTVNIIDTFDRPSHAYKKKMYAQARAYKHGLKDESGKRIPKAGYIAEAGIGKAHAEYSVFEAEAKGPNASFAAEASVVGVGAMARAEIASASAKAGPLGVKVGLGVDTGASAGLHGIEAKFLGTGVSIGPKTSVSVLDSEVSCSIM